MFENHWARKRFYDDYGKVMHNDWTFRKHQLSYQKHGNKEKGEWYRIRVRSRKGLFGLGATKWIIMQDVETHDECCALMHQYVDTYTEKGMDKWIENYHAKKEEQKNADLLKEHCGYSLEGIKW